MKKLFSLVRLISLCEIFGGIIGIVFTLKIFFEKLLPLLSSSIQPSLKFLIGGISLFVILLYLISIIAGVLLWSSSSLGFTLSKIVQFFQIPQISFGGVTYIFVSGFHFTVGVSLSPFQYFWKFLFGSTWSITFFQDPKILLGLNIVALVVFVYLKKQQKLVLKFDKKRSTV